VSIGNATFWLVAFIEVSVPRSRWTEQRALIFIWFCITGACVLGVVMWLAKETKGLSLEQIDLLWASEEYRRTNHEAQIIEAIGAEKDAVAGKGELA